MHLKVNQLIEKTEKTERLSIQKLTEKDGEFICRLVNSPGWIKYIGDRNVRNAKEAVEMLNERYISSYRKFGFGMYRLSLLASDDPIGICGFVQRDYLDQPDIGFAILPEYGRNGYTFEASMRLIKMISEKMGILKLYGVTAEDNIVSRDLLEKLGFQYKKTMIIPGSDAMGHIFYRNQKG